MHTKTLLLALAAVLPLAPSSVAAAAPADQVAAGSYVRARVWLEDGREQFRRGERLRVRFNVSDDAYVALLHIDSRGEIDFLYPSSPWDDGYVQRGRSYSTGRAGNLGLPVRGDPGIGYFYLVASPVPLDLSLFDGGRGGGWDWSYAGRSVHGDPFWAMEQITRHLLPDWHAVPYVTDMTHYYVEGRHRYPTYACGGGYGWDRGSRGGWGWSDGYASSCDRHALWLRDDPYYYDTRLWRGDRRARFRGRDYRVAEPAPRHGYKERIGVTGSDRRVPVRSLDEGDDERRSRGSVGVPRSSGGERAAEPSRRRPSLERRGGEGSSAPAPRAAPQGSRGATPKATVRPQAPPTKSVPRSRRPTSGSGGASGSGSGG